MKERANALDALRGYAIITMVLSATVVYGILPAWMHHFQEPPPTHQYDANLSGLTWVDLVFPSFLFAMGAAFPFSIGKKFAKGTSRINLLINALWRGVLLLFFAVFVSHFHPYMIESSQSPRSWSLALFCFAMLFAIYMRIPAKIPEWSRWAIQIGAMVIGTLVMINIDYANGYEFNLYTKDIIIFILAHMAVLASCIYIFTIGRPILRFGVLAFYGVMLFWATFPDSVGAKIMSYTPLDWVYNPFYLRYLFILIPASFAGEILMKWMDERNKGEHITNTKPLVAWGMIGVTLLMVIANMCCIYLHEIILSVVITLVLAIIGVWILKDARDYASLWKKLFILGSALMILGIACEPIDGGVKKDGPSFSYMFVTGAMATMLLIFFNVVCDYFKSHRYTNFLVMSGQNPMVAYVACGLVIWPLLQWTGITNYMGVFYTSPFMAFLQGVLLTTMAVLMTIFFTKMKCIWRT